MSGLRQNQPSESGGSEKQWNSIYHLGAIAAILVVLGSILDILISIALGGDLTSLPSTAAERLNQLHNNALVGLYNLDLLNLITTLIMIPATFAVCAAHRKVNAAFSAFAMIVSAIGAALFVANNGALPMLALSGKYAAASTETQRTILAAAGEALLASGEHGSPGAFLGFMLPLVAAILISCIMLKGKIFSKMGSYFGIAGNTLLLIYLGLVTFVPETKSFALALASPGGLLAIAWLIMISRGLFQMGSRKTESNRT
jgi:hypothetical protein